jgi:hypothetical protein
MGRHNQWSAESDLLRQILKEPKEPKELKELNSNIDFLTRVVDGKD